MEYSMIKIVMGIIVALLLLGGIYATVAADDSVLARTAFGLESFDMPYCVNDGECDDGVCKLGKCICFVDEHCRAGKCNMALGECV